MSTGDDKPAAQPQRGDDPTYPIIAGGVGADNDITELHRKSLAGLRYVETDVMGMWSDTLFVGASEWWKFDTSRVQKGRSLESSVGYVHRRCPRASDGR